MDQHLADFLCFRQGKFSFNSAYLTKIGVLGVILNISKGKRKSVVVWVTGPKFK